MKASKLKKNPTIFQFEAYKVALIMCLKSDINTYKGTLTPALKQH